VIRAIYLSYGLLKERSENTFFIFD